MLTLLSNTESSTTDYQFHTESLYISCFVPSEYIPQLGAGRHLIVFTTYRDKPMNIYVDQLLKVAAWIHCSTFPRLAAPSDCDRVWEKMKVLVAGLFIMAWLYLLEAAPPRQGFLYKATKLANTSTLKMHGSLMVLYIMCVYGLLCFVELTHSTCRPVWLLTTMSASWMWCGKERPIWLCLWQWVRLPWRLLCRLLARV